MARSPNLTTPLQTPAAKRSLSAKEMKWKKEVERFSASLFTVMKHAMLLTGLPGHQFGIVTTILLYISGSQGDQSTDADSLWKKLESLVKIEVGKGIAKYHMEATEKWKQAIQRELEKKEKFSLESWNDILRVHKYSFFPQNYESIGFDSRLATLPFGWTLQMVTGLGQLENLRKVPKCSVAKELMKVRGDVINAAREMFRKRYRDIQGIGYDKSGSVCNGMMMCSDNSKWTYKMKDGTSGENFNIVKRTDKSSNKVDMSGVTAIYKQTKKIIMADMVDRINALFHRDICRDGCEADCPSNITKEEVDFKFPTTCYGKKAVESQPECKTPCMTYGYSYVWCGVQKSRNWGYDYCKPANWGTCMPGGEIPYSFSWPQEFSEEDVADLAPIPDLSDLSFSDVVNSIKNLIG